MCVCGGGGGVMVVVPVSSMRYQYGSVGVIGECIARIRTGSSMVLLLVGILE